MHSALCAAEDTVREAIGGDLLVETEGRASEVERRVHDAMHDNFLEVMLGGKVVREARAKVDEERVDEATVVHHEGTVAGGAEGLRREAGIEDDELVQATAGSSDQIPRVSSSMYLYLSLGIENIPIPAFPVASLDFAGTLDTIMSHNYRYMSGKIEIDLAIGVPPGKPIFKVVLGLAGKMRISGSGSKANAISNPTMVLSNIQYGLYANADKVKATAVAAAKGVNSLVNAVDTPTHPSKVLEKYSEGFEKEYVDLLEDEWTYITATDGVTASSNSNSNNVPDDNTILQAIEWIEKMLENTPERKDDGTLVWKYTASAWYKFTSDLRYRLSADGTWTWSPDNEHWMPITEMTVKGGRWNGQKPSSDNQKTIKAIELIYVTLGGRHMASPNGGEETTRDDDAIEGDLNDVSYSPACSDRGGVCMDASKGATCPSGWIAGLCRGPAAIKCCVDDNDDAGALDDVLVSESANERADTAAEFWGGAEDPCDCETDGGRIGAYDPNAWGDQCRKWGGTSYKWCYVNGRSRNSCSKYTLRSSRGRYWRKCGLGVWASATVDDAVDTARDAKRTIDRHVDRAVDTARDAKHTIDRHVDRAVDAVNEHVVDPAARAINEHIVQPLTETQQGMWRRAKNVVHDVSQNWRRLKQEIGQTVRETGAFRFVQRTWFKDNAPRKPMLMFQGLAARMEKEGFSADDNLFERTLFKADALIFRDFTRVLSIREALFAFCKKNAGVKGVMEHMRKVLGNQEAFENGKTFRETTKQRNPDIAVPEGKKDISDVDNRVTMGDNPNYEQTGFGPNRDFATNGIRTSAVDRELKSNDREGATMGNDEALEMYALLSEEIVERYEHIETMAKMVARRLKRLGNPDWSALNNEQKEEYRSYFYSLRRLAAGLHGLLKQINAGNGPIKRGIVAGTAWVEKKVVSACDGVKAKMAAALGQNDWKLSSKFYLTISIGVSAKIPTPVQVGADFSVGWSVGYSGIVATSRLEDPTKTYSSVYSGPVFDLQVVFVEGKGVMFLALAKREVRTYHEDTYCMKKFSRAPCTETFNYGMLMFPTNFGIRANSLLPLSDALILMGIGNDLSNHELQPMSTSGIFGGGGGSSQGNDAISFSEYVPNDDAAEGVPSTAEFCTAQNLMHSVAPGVVKSCGEANGDETTSENESEADVERKGNKLFNLLKNYGAQALALSAFSKSNLGVLTFAYTYKIGEGDNVLRGWDKVFFKPFLEGTPTWAKGAIGKFKNTLRNLLGENSDLPIKLSFKIQPGPMIWPVLPGGAKRHVECVESGGTINSLGACTPGTSTNSNLAITSSTSTTPTADDELPCDQTFITTRLSSLREAIRLAEHGNEKVRGDTLAALKDMEEYERECSGSK